MMNHEQYRRAVLANPLGTDAELEAHRAHCEHCRAFTDRVLTFEHRLARALKGTTPNSAKILPFGTRSAARPSNGARWLASAASVARAFVVAPGSWPTPPPRPARGR